MIKAAKTKLSSTVQIVPAHDYMFWATCDFLLSLAGRAFIFGRMVEVTENNTSRIVENVLKSNLICN